MSAKATLTGTSAAWPTPTRPMAKANSHVIVETFAQVAIIVFAHLSGSVGCPISLAS
jgi:hypothetical protein